MTYRCLIVLVFDLYISFIIVKIFQLLDYAKLPKSFLMDRYQLNGNIAVYQMRTWGIFMTGYETGAYRLISQYLAPLCCWFQTINMEFLVKLSFMKVRIARYHFWYRLDTLYEASSLCLLFLSCTIFNRFKVSVYDNLLLS